MKNKLLDRESFGLLRTLKKNAGIDFISNDYLGYATLNLQPSNLQPGAAGSRLLAGNHPVFEETEKYLADVFHAEDALLFNSGYTANLGLISAISEKDTTILYDSLIHASIRDAIRMGFGTGWHFEHNDLDHLETLLKRSTPTRYVITESVFSMDGDLSPLKEMADLCDKYDAKLIVDEAHAGGIFGKQGEGLIDELGLTDRVFARVITFGKAFGRHGAVVLGSGELKQYLINFSRPFIYSTALPPREVDAIKKVVEYRLKDLQAPSRLKANIEKWNSLNESDLKSPIVIVPVEGGNEKAKALSQSLLEKGFQVPAILSPTVPKGKERLRICLHSFNSKEEISQLFSFVH